MGRSGNDGLIYLMTRQEGPPKPKPADRLRKVYGRDGGLFGIHPGWIALFLGLVVLAVFLLVLLG